MIDGMIATFIITLIVGGICIALGICNMVGNISSLHSYHRHRVAKEDIPAFGKLVGLGTVIVGASIVLMGAFLSFIDPVRSPALSVVGMCVTIAGLAVGIVLSLYAIIKYNKGLF